MISAKMEQKVISCHGNYNFANFHNVQELDLIDKVQISSNSCEISDIHKPEGRQKRVYLMSRRFNVMPLQEGCRAVVLINQWLPN